MYIMILYTTVTDVSEVTGPSVGVTTKHLRMYFFPCTPQSCVTSQPIAAWPDLDYMIHIRVLKFSTERRGIC